MDYTAPDKVDGNQWSPAEHNQAKTAINSKLDQSAVIDSGGAVSSNTVYSSLAVSSMLDVANTYRYQGTAAVVEDLASKTAHGYYLIEAAMISHLNTSFPANADGYEWGGTLFVTAFGGAVNHLMIINGLSDGPKFTKIYTNFSTDDGGTWDGWQEFLSVWNALSLFPTIQPLGTPEITSDDFTVTAADATDMTGRIDFVNNTGGTLAAGINIKVLFEYARPKARAALTTSYVTTIKANAYSITPDYVLFRIDQEILNGQGGSFFYNVLE